jgi:ABC transport system ATP-binding/permease protein
LDRSLWQSARIMPAPLLQLTDIHLTFGGTPLLQGAGLIVEPGERLCLVGRNGSGKSTLLKIAAGMVEADKGTVFRTPGATIRYLAQEPDFGAFRTAADALEAALAPGDDRFHAQQLLGALGLTGKESPATMSGGEGKRLAIAAALAPEPDLLLIDEPTNHLDLPAIEWLEDTLRASRSAIVMISHDRRFLQRLSRSTVWLDRGVTERIDQGFSAFEAWRDKRLEEEEIAQQKLARQIVREEHWLRYGVTARRKRNERRLGNLFALRQQYRDHKSAQGNVRMAATDAAESGAIVIEAKGIDKRFDAPSVVKDFSIRVSRGSRLGLIGANGSGKTTLVNLLTGQLAPDAGTVKIGETVALVTLDQKRMALDPATGVADTITDGRTDMIEVAGQRRHIMSYLKDFLFQPEQARTPVSRLSGGERARLLLAKALATPSNLIVLDEPTNDLDLETLDLLQELLADYTGTVILVSHDRDFLDRICTSVLMSEGQGKWVEYAGGYSDMLAQRGAGVAARKTGQVASNSKADAGYAASLAQPPSEAIRKASFKEQHRFKELSDRLPALERDIAKVESALGEDGLYARDAARFQKLSDMLVKLRSDLAASEEEWLVLSEVMEAT